MKKLYHIWETIDGHVLIPFDYNQEAMKLLDLVKILHAFEAESFGEALQVTNDYFGFGKYNYRIDPATGLPDECYSKHA